jgi:hypothetical protein
MYEPQVIRAKVLEQRLPMTILDAEYQFDRHKLTFFFEADRRIDFRELVSELFSLYKTRIWMQQVDTSAVGMHDAGAELAKATGFMPQRNDQEYLQVSQMHRMESATVGGGAYSATAVYQQAVPQLSQFGPSRATPYSAHGAFPSTLSGTAAPAMGLGLGTEPELALGLGLARPPVRAQSMDVEPQSGGLRLNAALPYRTVSDDGGYGGQWEAQRGPQQSVGYTSQHSAQPSPMLYSPLPGSAFASPGGRYSGPFTPQRGAPQPMQVSPYAGPQHMKQQQYPGGFQRMGMAYEGESLLGSEHEELFPVFNTPAVVPSLVRQPSRSLGTRSFELNANAPSWPPAASQELAGRSATSTATAMCPPRKILVERSESAEALLEGVQHSISASCTDGSSADASGLDVADFAAARAGDTAALESPSKRDLDELELLLDPNFQPTGNK